MLNKDKQVLYVGRTKSLKSRLSQHFNKKEWSQWKEKISSTEYLEIDNYGDSVVLETYFIHRYKAKYNKLGTEKGKGTGISIDESEWDWQRIDKELSRKLFKKKIVRIQMEEIEKFRSYY